MNKFQVGQVWMRREGPRYVAKTLGLLVIEAKAIDESVSIE